MNPAGSTGGLLGSYATKQGTPMMVARADDLPTRRHLAESETSPGTMLGSSERETPPGEPAASWEESSRVGS